MEKAVMEEAAVAGGGKDVGLQTGLGTVLLQRCLHMADMSLPGVGRCAGRHRSRARQRGGARQATCGALRVEGPGKPPFWRTLEEFCTVRNSAR